MQLAEFSIGLDFKTAAGKWRCTDVGTRVITAIRLDARDESWYQGPPYAVLESVFDENDQAGCWLVDQAQRPFQQAVADGELVRAADVVLAAIDSVEFKEGAMAYMRGADYLWSDGQRLHLWIKDGNDGWEESVWLEGARQESPQDGRGVAPSGVGIEQTTIDEYVVMRFAELLRAGAVEATVRRALDRWHGNVGCQELARTVQALRAS